MKEEKIYRAKIGFYFANSMQKYIDRYILDMKKAKESQSYTKIGKGNYKKERVQNNENVSQTRRGSLFVNRPTPR